MLKVTLSSQNTQASYVESVDQASKREAKSDNLSLQVPQA